MADVALQPAEVMQGSGLRGASSPKELPTVGNGAKHPRQGLTQPRGAASAVRRAGGGCLHASALPRSLSLCPSFLAVSPSCAVALFLRVQKADTGGSFKKEKRTLQEQELQRAHDE